MIGRVIICLLFAFALWACEAEKVEAGSSTGPIRQFSGVWVYQFEGSTFVEGAGSASDAEIPFQDAAWLDFHPGEVDPLNLHEGIESARQDYDTFDPERQCYPRFAFAISFEGARTTYQYIAPNLPGGGHMGLWGSDISVAKVTSISPLDGFLC